MSELSERLYGPKATPVEPKPTPKPTPKPKPKPPAMAPTPGDDPRFVGFEHGVANTLGKAAQAYLKYATPAEGIMQVGHALNAATQGGAQRAASGVMNALDVPFGSLGAELEDVERAVRHPHTVSRNQPIGDALTQMFPATKKFYQQLGKGHLGEAIQEHSLTSLPATVARAKKYGFPAEQAASHHPSWFGVGAGALEAVNPASAGAGELAGLGLRGGAALSRAAGVDLSRFSGIENAAITEAERRGLPGAHVAGQQARAAARMVANAPHYGEGTADAIVGRVFRPVARTKVGKAIPLTLAQQTQIVDAVEGELTLPIKGSRAWNRMTPEQIAERKMIVGRANEWRAEMRKLDKLQVGAGLDPARLWTTENFFPRKGFSVNPLDSLDEEVQETLRSGKSGGGGPSYRVGSAGEKVHRTHPTRIKAMRAGVELNPDWRPSQAAWNHVAQRIQNARLEQGLQEFDRLGLLEPREAATRTDYVPFTEVGKVRNLGAPTTRDSVAHPAVVRLLEDLQPATSPKAITLGGKAMQVLPWLSRQAARMEVTSPIYHPLVNLLRNYARGGNPIELIKALTKFGSKAAEDQAGAREAGAVLPHVSRMPMGQRVLGFKERSTPMTGRIADTLEHPLNLVSSEPVYKHIEPRMASAFYKSLLSKGVNEAEAVERTRQMLGDPEGLSAATRSVANQALIFPTWVASMMKYWGKELATHPQLYMSPHRAVEARNLSRGMSPKATDYYKLIPDVAGRKPGQLGAPKDKGQEMLTLPHPANRLTGLAGLATDILGGAIAPQKAITRGLGFLSPGLATAGRGMMTELLPGQEPGYGILWDKDAPQNVQSRQKFEQALGYYAPARPGGTTGTVPELLGVGGYNLPSGSKIDKSLKQLDTKVRHSGIARYDTGVLAQRLGVPRQVLPANAKFTWSLTSLRSAAIQLRSHGYGTAGARLDKAADQLWARLEKAKTKYGAPEP